MNKTTIPTAILVAFAVSTATAVHSAEKPASAVDKELAADLALLQGSWELLHGNEGKGPPSTRSIKTIEGNKETLRRYSFKTGELRYEGAVEFKLNKSGSVRVFTFRSSNAPPELSLSYVYKVDTDNFYDIPGLLHGDKYQNYQVQPRIWHWKRVPKNDPDLPENEGDTNAKE